MKHTLVKTVASVMSLCMLASSMPLAHAADAPVYPGNENLTETTAVYTSAAGATCSVTCAKDGDQIVLVDLKRNIRIVDASTRMWSVSGEGAPITSAVDETKWNQCAELLAAMQSVYDFYHDTLKRTDFDFNSKHDDTIYAAVVQSGISDTRAVKEAKIYYNGQMEVKDIVPCLWVSHGDEVFNSLGSDISAVGHEFTHFVTMKELEWCGNTDNSFESAALMEAYSDIMGELCEDEPDWKAAAHAIKNDPQKNLSERDIANPAGTQKPTPVDEEFLDDYNVFLTRRSALEHYKQPKGGSPASYLVSTIISHAAYEMYAAGIGKDELAKAWYASIDYYSGNTKQATLLDCRNAVCAAAADYFYSKYSADEAAAKLKIVEDAFAAANLKPSQAEAESTDYMAGFVRREQAKFPSGTYWNTGDPDTWSNEPVYADRSSYLPMGPTVYPFWGLTGWQTEEEYFQCAGFAKKLQEDYFGRTVMIQDDNPHYVPQIGDHLRLEHYIWDEPTGAGHSIFVTGVDGDTITYADCNADGSCMINWNQTGKLVRNSEGNICLNGTGRYHDEFAWVERPLKQSDVNADGKIDRYDCWQLRYLAEGKADSVQENEILRWHAANLNGDDKIDLADLDLLDRLTYSPSAKDRFGFVAF
ncbi:MAG: M4 family metallopeptidase [Oscillospiraceae bacterium]|nr:M4 family metallopeptidase [Oscillospiraceae bacterium]